ncbi:MAG: hypothetical protein HFI78_14825 [Lachnospiraceae bacterium]|jgi:hypothetical protein|nr:hypothetical protein [Lachnospiraceae bacterium]
MKKRVVSCFLIVICMVSICLWTSPKKAEEQDSPIEEKGENESERKVQWKVEYRGENYLITLYNEDGKEIEELLFAEKPEVKEIGGELLEVSIRTGEHDRETFYFHKKMLQKSYVYVNPTILLEKYIYYMKDNKLLVHDIFLEGMLHEEVIRDFSMTEDPISYVHILSCSNETFLIFRYKKGKEEEDIREVLKIFPDEERKAEEVYKEVLWEKGEEPEEDTVSRIGKNQYAIEPIGEDYRVCFYDERGKEVDRTILPIEPWIREIGEEILEIGISTENSERYVFYFHKKTLQKSNTYLNPTVFSEQYIYYMENTEVIIHDIFLEGRLYEEIYRYFSPVDSPVKDMYIVPCSHTLFLNMEYEKEDAGRVWEVIKALPKNKEDVRKERSKKAGKEYEDIPLEKKSFSIIEKEQYKVEHRGEFYIVTLYDEKGNKVKRALYTEEPEVKEMGRELLEVSIGAEGEEKDKFYFHKRTLQISPTYLSSTLLSEKYIHYMKDNKLIVHDIFLEGTLYEEIIRDFSNISSPVSHVHTFSCSNQEFLILRYKTKEHKEEVREILEIYPDNGRKAEKVLKEKIWEKEYETKEEDRTSIIEKKQYKKEFNGEEYIVYLYDEQGKEIDRITYSKEPWVREIGKDLLNVRVSFGNPASYDLYFHKKTLQESKGYFNSTLLSEKYVSYRKDNKLIVHDIFLEGILYEEITRDFKGVSPVSDLYIFPCSNKTFLIFEYYNGEDYMREAVEIFPEKK